MEAARHIPEEEFHRAKDAEVINLGLVADLLEHHREDYKGMIPEEKSQFITHLKSDLAHDDNIAIAEAAKVFLKEVEGEYEN